jgi:hypothetical protein
MSLSETELNDKNLISNTLFTDSEKYVSNLTTQFPETILYISMKPPMRCSDGKRRSNLMDYVDFLFGDEQIEDLIQTKNAETPGFTRSMHQFDWGFEIKFKLNLTNT